MSPRHAPANTFVRRLIPTVTAATLTFACTPEPDEKDPNAAPNNMTANNTSPNSSTANNAAPNSTTSNNTTANNVTPNNVTPNNVTPNNTTGNNSTANNGTGANVTVDGTVTTADIQAFCQAFSDCDTTYFQESYGTVEDCATQMEQYLMEGLSYFEQDGPECLAALQGEQECYLAAARCGANGWGVSDQAYEGCYAQFEADFAMYCNAGE